MNTVVVVDLFDAGRISPGISAVIAFSRAGMMGISTLPCMGYAIPVTTPDEETPGA
jgi:hypothetical protein